LADDPAGAAAVRGLRAQQRDLKERLFNQKNLPSRWARNLLKSLSMSFSQMKKFRNFPSV
jgi:hypothetical protein